ncbi:MAG: carboxy-S-adenosyl-L-methionine synthase CmoA [Thiotrichales bacterium]
MPISREQPDQIYAEPRASIGRFAFDEAVTQVFADMINRSVPGYQTVLGMLTVFAQRFSRDGSRIYDLGCSLGASTLMLRQGAHPGSRIIAIDNAPAMVEQSVRNITADAGTTPVEVGLGDILEVTFEPASLIVLNYTLQFVPPPQRLPLLQRIHAALSPGDALVLAEKVRFTDDAHQNLMTELHHGFKKANGYSDLEISQKRAALEAVLQPDTLDEHTARLRHCGFSATQVWFQCLNFVGLVAIK